MDEYGRVIPVTTAPVRDGAAVATDRAAEARCRDRTDGDVTVGAENANHEERDERGDDVHET